MFHNIPMCVFIQKYCLKVFITEENWGSRKTCYINPLYLRTPPRIYSPIKQLVERTLDKKLEDLGSMPGPNTRQLWDPRPVTTSLNQISSVVADLMCQLDWTTGCPDIQSNIILAIQSVFGWDSHLDRKTEESRLHSLMWAGLIQPVEGLNRTKVWLSPQVREKSSAWCLHTSALSAW